MENGTRNQLFNRVLHSSEEESSCTGLTNSICPMPGELAWPSFCTGTPYYYLFDQLISHHQELHHIPQFFQTLLICAKMAPKQVILTENAPKPLPGVYSQAIVANGTVYCSGSIGMDPTTGKLVEGDIQARTVRRRPPFPCPRAPPTIGTQEKLTWGVWE